MITIPNPEVAKIQRNDAINFKGVIKRANRYAKSLEALYTLIASPSDYVADMLPEAAKQLELSFLKLVELYSLPLTPITQLAGELQDSEYLPFVVENEDGIELDMETVEKHIEQTAVIELRGQKELLWKEAEKLSERLNALKYKLAKEGGAIQLANIIKSDYAGNWSPNKAFILTIQV